MSFLLRQKQVVLLQEFVHLYKVIPPHIFSTHSDTRFIVFISIMLMDVFSLFLLSHFFALNFVMLLQILLTTFTYFCSRKANVKCCNKREKHNNIIIEQVVRSVAEIIFVSKASALCLCFANILAIPTFCIGEIGRIKNI